MKITDTQIVSYMLDVQMPTNDLVNYLQVIQKLLKKYGRVIFSEGFQNEIKKVEPQVVYLLESLAYANKTDVQTIKHIIILLKQHAKDYHKEFVVKTDTDQHCKQVEGFLNGKFSSSVIEQHQSEGNSVRISGEGWYYKRGLEQDAKKLLGL